MIHGDLLDRRLNITRFAPSPTGFLHLGHGAAALFARERGERMLLRIEDIDPVRCRADYAAAIEEDLAWLGVRWDGPVWRQSEHLGAYAAVLERLGAEGLVYPCFCSRAAVAREVTAAGHAPHGPEAVVYPGTCRKLGAGEREERVARGEPYALRLDMSGAVRRIGALSYEEMRVGAVACDPAGFGDVVLGRREVRASYHLCVAHDDAVQGVTLVTRGEDLRPATAVHRVLQAVMGWAAPRYWFHPLLLDGQGRRLSKRDGARSIREMRAAGASAAEITGWARAALS